MRIRVVALLAAVLVTGLVSPVHAQGPMPSSEGAEAGNKPGPQVPMGREWRPTPLPPADARIRSPAVWSLTAWDGGFAALGTRLLTRRRGAGESVWLSEDGESWDVVRAPFEFSRDLGGVQLILAFRGGLIALGADGMRFAAWRSRDGRIWKRVPDQPAFVRPRIVPATTYSLYLQTAIAAHGRLVVYGTYGPNGGDRENFSRVWTTRNGRDWAGGRHDGAVAADADDKGYVGLAMVRRWPRGIDCDYGTLYEVAQSRDGRTWKRVPGSMLPCGAYGGIGYHPETDAYFVVRDTFGVPEILRSRNLKDWSVVPLGEAMFGHPRTEWWPERITIDEGLIAIVGGSSQDRLWSLISSDGREWELSTGWPAMYEVDGINGVAVHRGRIVTVTDWRQNQAWMTDVGGARETRGPALIEDCLDHDESICLAIEATIEHRLGGRAIERIELLGHHVCPWLWPDCPRPTRGERRKYVEGAEVWLAGTSVPLLGNVWLPRAHGNRPPKFDLISAGQCRFGRAGWTDRITPDIMLRGPGPKRNGSADVDSCLALRTARDHEGGATAGHSGGG